MMDDKLQKLREYLEYYIEQIANKERIFYRVIFDAKFRFPDNYYIINDDFVEVSNERWFEHPRNGWSKPDFMIGENIECRKLWKNLRIKTFNEFCL